MNINPINKKPLFFCDLLKSKAYYQLILCYNELQFCRGHFLSQIKNVGVNMRVSDEFCQFFRSSRLVIFRDEIQIVILTIQKHLNFALFCHFKKLLSFHFSDTTPFTQLQAEVLPCQSHYNIIYIQYCHIFRS